MAARLEIANTRLGGRKNGRQCLWGFAIDELSEVHRPDEQLSVTGLNATASVEILFEIAALSSRISK